MAVQSRSPRTLRQSKTGKFRIGFHHLLMMAMAWFCLLMYLASKHGTEEKPAASPSTAQQVPSKQEAMKFSQALAAAKENAGIPNRGKETPRKDKTSKKLRSKDVKVRDTGKKDTEKKAINKPINQAVIVPPVETPPVAVKKNGIQVAYAVSLVKCGDKQSTAAGLTDAVLVMRHSIHLTHLQSKYDYKMYAIVHKQAEACGQTLKDAGFEIVLVDQPVDAEKDIRGAYLKKNIHKEWCCGEQEFIKLYAYNLPDPIVVHVDIDFAFMKPMDDLFDAIIYDKDSPEGKAARSRIPLERPEEGFPDTIGAFITRDWPQVMPGRKPLYQAGFLVARRDPSVIDEVVDVIKEGNYTEGYSPQNGWGGKGYGGMVGAMAMQGTSM